MSRRVARRRAAVCVVALVMGLALTLGQYDVAANQVSVNGAFLVGAVLSICAALVIADLSDRSYTK